MDIGIGMFIGIFYLALIVGSIVLLIWTIISRVKEKKEEKAKLDKYKKY